MDFKHLLFSIVCLLFLGIIYKKIHNYIETDERKEDLNLIARNPAAARRKLKSG